MPTAALSKLADMRMKNCYKIPRWACLDRGKPAWIHKGKSCLSSQLDFCCPISRIGERGKKADIIYFKLHLMNFLTSSSLRKLAHCGVRGKVSVMDQKPTRARKQRVGIKDPFLICQQCQAAWGWWGSSWGPGFCAFINDLGKGLSSEVAKSPNDTLI